MFRRTRAGSGPISGSEIPVYLYNSRQPEMKTAIPWADTTSRGGETSTPLADR